MNHSASDLAAWRTLAKLMPGWRPTLAGLRKLDEGPNEFGEAVRSISRGWSYDDARWDVLQGVLEFAKRHHAHELADQQRLHFGVGGAPIPAHCDPRCDFCRGAASAADFIDPKAQGASTEGEPT